MRKSMLYCFLLFCTLVLPAARASAEEVVQLSLDDALQRAMERNRDLQLAVLEERKSSAQVREAWSGVLPQVSAGFDYTRNIKPTVIYFPDPAALSGGGASTAPLVPLQITQDNAMNASLTLSQPLIDLKAFAGIKASSIVRDISREAYRNAVSSTMTTVSIAYYNVLIADAQYELVRQSLERWQKALEDTKAMFAEGMAADIDTLKAHLSVENIRPDLLKAQNNCSIVRTELKNLLDLAPSARLRLVDSLACDPASAVVPEFGPALAEALRSRPDIRQLELQVEAEQVNVSATRAQSYPAVSAVGQLTAQTQYEDGVSLSDTDWPVTSSVGVSLSMPLFTGFRISSQVEQAKVSRMQAATRLEQLRAEVRGEVEIRLASLAEARKRIEVQQKTIMTAERGYDISRLRLREGVGSQLELADAELQLQRAKTNYLQAVYDLLVERVRLDAALGRIAVQERPDVVAGLDE
ncbi:MAG: TolC family protein [Prosthecochloris sp.]|nr:TolC family protein [Prosthecochloris sp.]